MKRSKSQYGASCLVTVVVALMVVCVGSVCAEDHTRDQQDIVTFSIVAHDSTTGELGVAVASRFFAVGSMLPWAKAGVGAVATQSFATRLSVGADWSYSRKD